MTRGGSLKLFFSRVFLILWKMWSTKFNGKRTTNVSGSLARVAFYLELHILTRTVIDEAVRVITYNNIRHIVIVEVYISSIAV